MSQRIRQLYIRFKLLGVIPPLILVHFSVLIFISNISAKEFTNSRTLFSHSSRQINNIVINKIVRTKRKCLKINIVQTNNLISTISKPSVSPNLRVIKFSELTFLKFDEYINSYIEFRPPPKSIS